MVFEKVITDMYYEKSVSGCREFYYVFQVYPEQIGVHPIHYTLAIRTVHYPILPTPLPLSDSMSELPQPIDVKTHIVKFVPLPFIGITDILYYHQDRTGWISISEIESALKRR